MDVKQIKLFADLVNMYDLVCEVYVNEMDDIDTIQRLANAEEWDAIETLFNEDEDYDTGEDMFLEHFGKSLDDMNKLCDEYGYSRVEVDDD